jgi:hypothetical protein
MFKDRRLQKVIQWCTVNRNGEYKKHSYLRESLGRIMDFWFQKLGTSIFRSPMQWHVSPRQDIIERC